jgi:cyclopropane-fatty-acyl-phospholipid synthase
VKQRLHRFVLTRLLHRLTAGRIVVIEGGRRRCFGPPDAELRATVTIHDPVAWSAPLRGSLGLGEAYFAGRWETDDLVSLLRIAARQLAELRRLRLIVAKPRGWLHRLRRLVPENTRRGARANIAAHYDLGNELFGAFLDERMVYSCAWFPHPAPPSRRRSWPSWSESAACCGSARTTTCWRSAAAGAAWRSTPRPSTDAG